MSQPRNSPPESFLLLYAHTEHALPLPPHLVDLEAVIAAAEGSRAAAALLRILIYPEAIDQLLKDLYRIALDLGEIHREGSASAAVWLSGQLSKLLSAPPSMRTTDVLGENADIAGLIMLARARVTRGEGGPKLVKLLKRLEAEG